MRTPRSASTLSRVTQAALAVLLLGIMLLTSACGGDSHLQQQVSQSRTKLDQLVQQAQTIGVPVSLLQPIMQQEQQLNSTGAPLNPFNDQLVNDYYHNIDTRYAQLHVQLQGLITAVTEQYEAQAKNDMQNFEAVLSQRGAQHLPIQHFSQQLSQYEALMTTAKYPKDFSLISNNAHISTQSLNLLNSTAEQIATFKSAIDQMRAAHLDVTVMQMQYESDQQALANSTSPADFQKLGTQINAQYQQAMVNSTAAMPYITAAKLNEFEKQINLLKSYGIDPTNYQKQLDADRSKLNETLSIQDYTTFARQVDTQVASMHNDLIRGEAQYTLAQFHREVNAWSSSHVYHDSFDGQNYAYDPSYMQQGIGSNLDADLAAASNPQDYQNVLNEIQTTSFNFHLLQADYKDTTPYNQVHTTDMQALDHYNLRKGQVVVVSLVNQSLRLYQDGQLVRAFLVTTGRYELPTVPGVWSVLDRRSPTVFKSSEPKTSPYWYPDTPIHYAILFQSAGYFIHDAWWRNSFGPGTQFPHADSAGSSAEHGSHGCVNMSQNDASWLYQNTGWNTTILVY